MTHEEYIQTLPENERQFATELIQELSKISEITVYHTDTNDGDLRVRIGANGRVMFTMNWQSRNKSYFCRCFVETLYLDAQSTFFGVLLEKDYEPLVSSFRFKSNYVNTMSALTALVQETVKRYQFFLQNKAKK